MDGYKKPTGRGFISTLSYNTLRHLLPYDPISSSIYLFPDELCTPDDTAVLPNMDVPPEHLKKINDSLKNPTAFSFDDLLAYWFSFYNNPTLQGIPYFTGSVAMMTYNQGQFIHDFGSASHEVIRRYRSENPTKKDTDVYLSIICRDEALYAPPFTLSYITEYHNTHWNLKALEPLLRWFFEYSYDKYVYNKGNLHENDAVGRETSAQARALLS